jgi:heterodisulfide reductase subunit B
MRLNLYLGCVIPTEQYAYELSLREVLPPLGVELVDIENHSCCGAPLRSINLFMATYLGARNLAVSEKEGLDVLAPCPLCHLALSEVKLMLGNDAALKDKVNGLLSEEGLKYDGKANVFHVLDLLHDSIGVEKIKEHVKSPLTDMNVAAHYGCHLIRPHRTGRPDDSENPQKMETLLTAIGAKSGDYKEKLNCCGAPVSINHPDSALTKTGQKLKAVQDQGFDALANMCPWGHRMMDDKQESAGQTIGESISIPVIYFTQLLGLAMGIERTKLGLDLNQSPVDKLGKEG